MDAISIKTDTETKELFKQLYEDAKLNGECTTQQSFMELLLERFQNPKKIKDPEMEAKVKELEESLASEADRNKELQNEITQLNKNLSIVQEHNSNLVSSTNSLTAEVYDANDTIAKVKKEHEELLQQYENLKASTESKSIIDLDDVSYGNILVTKDDKEQHFCVIKLGKVQSLILNELAKRLSEYYKKEVTVGDILVDVPLRYVILQYTEWFFPFVIRQSEFKDICGVSYDGLKKWLKKN